MVCMRFKGFQGVRALEPNRFKGSDPLKLPLKLTPKFPRSMHLPGP